MNQALDLPVSLEKLFSYGEIPREIRGISFFLRGKVNSSFSVDPVFPIAISSVIRYTSVRKSRKKAKVVSPIF